MHNLAKEESGGVPLSVSPMDRLVDCSIPNESANDAPKSSATVNSTGRMRKTFPFDSWVRLRFHLTMATPFVSECELLLLEKETYSLRDERYDQTVVPIGVPKPGGWYPEQRVALMNREISSRRTPPPWPVFLS